MAATANQPSHFLMAAVEWGQISADTDGAEMECD